MGMTRSKILGFVKSIMTAPLPKKRVHRRVRVQPQTAVSAPGHKVTVEREFQPVWLEQGWKKKGTTYSGFYRTAFGAYKGKIELLYQFRLRFLIWSPPSCLWKHPQATCFLSKGRNLYEVHFSKIAATPDDGIIEIEKILTEAHKQELR